MARILLSAYACEPGKGSEPEVGWMWATELAAAGHEVWVITRATNRAAIEACTNARRPPLLHFVYFDLPALAAPVEARQPRRPLVLRTLAMGRLPHGAPPDPPHPV